MNLIDNKFILDEVKKKKELEGISDKIIEEALESYSKKNRINLNSLSKKELKLVVKDIRSELRKLSGRFSFSPNLRKQRENLLKEGKIDEILLTHSSTSERIKFYPLLIKKIEELNPSSILDLGCGLNPLALSDMKTKYYALDIVSDELSLIKDYFLNKKTKGETIEADLRKIDSFKKNLPKVDLCLIFKVFDILEKKGHKLAEKIINSVDSNKFIISFSTKTLSGKPMNHPQRGWIERLLNRLGFKYEILKSKNEIFYIAEKSN